MSVSRYVITVCLTRKSKLVKIISCWFNLADTNVVYIGHAYTNVVFRQQSFQNSILYEAVISGSLSPRHDASSGCGWKTGFQMWRIDANILNKQSRTADKGWSSSFGGLCEVLTTSHRKNVSCYEMFTRALDLD